MEERYQVIEKFVLSLIFLACGFKQYFWSFNIIVRTNYPIKQVLQKLERTSRMTAWFVDLSEFILKFESWGPMKVIFLGDFLIEFLQLGERHEWWSLSVDASSNKKGNMVGVILEGLDDITFEQAVQFNFDISDN